MRASVTVNNYSPDKITAEESFTGKELLPKYLFNGAYLLLNNFFMQEISTLLKLVWSVIFSHFCETSLLKLMEAATQRCSFK